MSDAQEALPNPNPEGSELEPHQSVHIDPEALARHYEQDDVNAASLVRYGAAIIAGSAIASGILYLVLTFWSARPLPTEVQLAPTNATPPAVVGPGLDAVPEFRLADTLLRENERLTTYGWVDEASGAARIPIDEAMRLMVERGSAARDVDAPDFRLHPAFRLDASGGLEPAGNNRFGEVGAGEGDTDEGGSVVDEGSESPTEGSTDTGAPETENDTGGDADDETGSESDSETEQDAGGDVPSGGGDQDDEGGAPGTIGPGEEDAEGEEPGGAQSGS